MRVQALLAGAAVALAATAVAHGRADATPTPLAVASVTVSATLDVTREEPSVAQGRAQLTAQRAPNRTAPVLRSPRGAVTVPLRVSRTESLDITPSGDNPYEEPVACREPAAVAVARGALELRPVGRNVDVRLTLPGVVFARCPGPRAGAPQQARVLVRRVPAASLQRARTSVTLTSAAGAQQASWTAQYRTRAVVTLVRR